MKSRPYSCTSVARIMSITASSTTWLSCPWRFTNSSTSTARRTVPFTGIRCLIMFCTWRILARWSSDKEDKSVIFFRLEASSVDLVNKCKALFTWSAVACCCISIRAKLSAIRMIPSNCRTVMGMELLFSLRACRACSLMSTHMLPIYSAASLDSRGSHLARAYRIYFFSFSTGNGTWILLTSVLFPWCNFWTCSATILSRASSRRSRIRKIMSKRDKIVDAKSIWSLA
mmetsp:Transcript_8087/g.17535  ORF Transcript_8087/g.17535 Transcript_8087/m.17535 type:complete len:229 (-) Transcript_8087:1508-2194(-)